MAIASFAEFGPPYRTWATPFSRREVGEQGGKSRSESVEQAVASCWRWDLAWRMARRSAGGFSIDGELHLHPSWQQRVLPDLARTFPNTQFVVSTHSPQVLTSVRPDYIVELRREDGNIVADPASAPTYGAEAGDVLAAVMGVSERPSGNEFVKCLGKYMRLIGRDRGESEEAISIRRRLESLSPRDPALDRADVEIRRRKLMRGMRKS